ncbi:MAG: hypothetical protein ACC628_19045 [Pirellulaceae bacterium]
MTVGPKCRFPSDIGESTTELVYEIPEADPRVVEQLISLADSRGLPVIVTTGVSEDSSWLRVFRTNTHETRSLDKSSS